MKFNKKYLTDELDLPESAIEDKIVGNRRWSVDHQIIFKLGDKFYSAYYSVGATEYQEEYPWEHEHEVKCVEVHQVEKTIKIWEKKKNEV